MGEPVEEHGEMGSLRRAQISLQRTRAAAFVLLWLVAIGGRSLGQLTLDRLEALALMVSSFGSALLFEQLYRRRFDRRWGLDITPVWMALDVLFITWALQLSGETSGLWLVWYLTNTAAAAFIGGSNAALGVALGNCSAYLALMVARGEIRGFDDGLVAALFRLVVLYGAGFIFLRGIAELRRKRLEIRQLVAEKGQQLEELSALARTLEERSGELAEATSRSREANRAKSQFLANMSHELRTPLNSIIGFSEILNEKLGDGLEPRYRKFLGNILDSGRHLLGLINDILDLSKIEAGKMILTLERVSLVDVVHGVRSVMSGIAGKRRIDLRLELEDGLPLVVGDGPKIKQILYNLVSNAVKFSPDGMPVVLGARHRAADQSPLGVESVTLWVEDRGIGIAPEHHEMVFQELQQVDGASTRAHGGTGLGLALVRRFVQMHGGRVSLESELGQGSTFRVELPCDASKVMVIPETAEVVALSQEAIDAARAARDASETEKTQMVLIVEDDEPFARAVQRDLETAGYRTFWARHGEEALAWLADETPSVITLDLELPGMDGWEVLKRLKGQASTASVPVIIVSLVENPELGFALGADDYFVKPLERHRFLARLETLASPAGQPMDRSDLLRTIDSVVRRRRGEGV